MDASKQNEKKSKKQVKTLQSQKIAVTPALRVHFMQQCTNKRHPTTYF